MLTMDSRLSDPFEDLIAMLATMADDVEPKPGPGPPDVAPKPGPPDVAPKPGPPDVAPKPGPPDVAPKPGPPDVAPH